MYIRKAKKEWVTLDGGPLSGVKVLLQNDRGTLPIKMKGQHGVYLKGFWYDK